MFAASLVAILAAAALMPTNAAAAPPPALAALAAQKIVTSSAIETDRRPMAAGIYDPAVHKTFISWMGKNSDSYVQAYDHSSGVWSAPKKVGTSAGDSHNYPVLVQTDTGQLLVFHGAHNAPLKLAKSPQPHTIDGTWTDTTMSIAAAASYPMPVKAANGDIYVFYRETLRTIDGASPTDTRPLRYLVSTNDGSTWTRSSGTYALGSTTRTDNLNEIYMGQIRAATFNGVERFHMVWTLAGGGPGSHLHDAYHKNLYYCSFQPSNRHFFSATNTDLGTSVDNTEQENSCKALDTPLVRKLPLSRDIGYTHLVDLLSDGSPYLVYSRQDGETPVIMTARRSGGAWVHAEVTRGGRLSDMERVSPDSFRAYIGNESAPRVPSPGIKTFLLGTGSASFEQEISTIQPIQHLELIPSALDPVRAVATGFSTSDDPADDNGDIYIVGAPAAPTCSAATVTAVTASSDDGNVAANTLDDNPATRWSASGDGQWIRFDLGALRSVCSATISFYKATERQSIFELQISVDGTAWTTVWSGQSSGGAFSFTPTSARHVRYLGHGNTVNAWNSLTEVDLTAT